MPDWNSIVRKKLKTLSLDIEQQEEVVAELAGHVEELFEQFRARGLNESEAWRLSLEDSPDWRKLAQKIERAKREEGAMNNRTKTLWIPGLVSLTTASTLLMVLERVPFLQPTNWLRYGGSTPSHFSAWLLLLPIHLSWWLFLPLCGAAGARLSQRAGGQRLNCILAGLFPSIVMLSVFCTVLPISILIERNVYVLQHPTSYLLAIVHWTVVPGMALFVGTIPFLRRDEVRLFS